MSTNTYTVKETETTYKVTYNGNILNISKDDTSREEAIKTAVEMFIMKEKSDYVNKHLEFYDALDEEGKRNAYYATALDLSAGIFSELHLIEGETNE
jgi:hypothetical protein